MSTATVPLARPTRRDEAWRYAPHKVLDQLVLEPQANADTSVADDVLAQLPELDGAKLVIVNGIVNAELSNFDEPAGLSLSTLAQKRNTNASAIAAHFGGQPADVFEATNQASAADGAVITVADDAQVTQPIQVVHIASPGSANATSYAGVVIHVGQGASASVVETHVGNAANAGGSHVLTTVTLGQGATLNHLVLQDAPSNHVVISQVSVSQEANSTYNAHAFNLGASYGRLAFDVALSGNSAHTDLSGLYFGFGDQTLDQQVTVTHDATNCTSRQSFRGVLDDQSAGIFNGGIDVRPGADGTDAEQANDNLILSDRAEANSQPRLEILADDVACKHGSTVGQLDDTALYYLRSRGIGATQARRLLIDGFAHQVLDTVEIEAVRTWVSKRIGQSDA